MASVTFDITYMPTIVDKLGLSVECPLVADLCLTPAADLTYTALKIYRKRPFKLAADTANLCAPRHRLS